MAEEILLVLILIQLVLLILVRWRMRKLSEEIEKAFMSIEQEIKELLKNED